MGQRILLNIRKKVIHLPWSLHFYLNESLYPSFYLHNNSFRNVNETIEDELRIYSYDIASYFSSDCSDKILDQNNNLIDRPLNWAVTQKKLANGSDDTYAIQYAYMASNDCSVEGKATVALSETNRTLNPVYSKHAAMYFSTAADALAELDDISMNSTKGELEGYTEKYFSTTGCAANGFIGGNWYAKDVCHQKLTPNSAFNNGTVNYFKWTDIQTIEYYDSSECGQKLTDRSAGYPKFTPDLTYCQRVPSSKAVSGIPVLGSFFVQSGNIFESQSPTSSPTFIPEVFNQGIAQVTWDKRRTRKGGLCENRCSGHGTCEVNQNCVCYKGLDGEAEWTSPDCSERTCPHDYAWVGSVVNANDLHPWAECSNKGICDRKSGLCACFSGYDGIACQRSLCPGNCNNRGTCWPEKYLAEKAGRSYNQPWDSLKAVGCVCDAGFRGTECELQECPSGTDPLDGYGSEAGRDCSGRGLCDFSVGICNCFSGFFGTRCQHQTTLI